MKLIHHVGQSGDVTEMKRVSMGDFSVLTYNTAGARGRRGLSRLEGGPWLPVSPSTHAVVPCTVGAPDEHRDLGHVGAGDRRHHLGSVLSDPTGFVLPAHHEALTQGRSRHTTTNKKTNTSKQTHVKIHAFQKTSREIKCLTNQKTTLSSQFLPSYPTSDRACPLLNTELG